MNFDYPNHFANVWQATTLDIRAVGLESYAPVCSLLTGDLPKGLAFEANSCRISGTPTELGSASPTIRLTARGVTGQVDEQIQFVVQGPSADYAGLGGDVHLGLTYRYTTVGVYGSNAPWAPLPGQTQSYAITSGSLPHGLALDAGSGTISGVPDQAGYFAFTVQASATSGANVVNSPLRSYALTASLPAIAVSYPDLTLKKVGDTLTIQPSIFYPSDAQADKVSLSFQIEPLDTLPPGLTLDPKTGVIAGTLTGPVPGQNPGQPSSWLYNPRFIVTVTTGGYSFILRSYIHLTVAP